MTRVAVVTGANKGIGLAIVEALVDAGVQTIYLTARDPVKGNAAVAGLKNRSGVLFHQLDILDDQSVAGFAEHLKSQHGGIDILVNNAGMAFKRDSTAAEVEQATTTIETNFYGTRRVCTGLIPLLNKGARLVNMSSSEGALNKVPSEELKKKLTSETLTDAELCAIMEDYKAAVKAGARESQGWPCTHYRASKVGVSALTALQAREVQKSRPDDGILVNCAHPGYVKTDMTSQQGFFETARGAESSVFCALLPAKATQPQGCLVWHDKTVHPWKYDHDWSQC